MNSFNYSKTDLGELVALTSQKLALPELYVIEKDLFVTKAISVLTAVEDDFFHLVFQGGTALA